jgi:predicted RNase H-like HicB family nuclease
MRPISNDTGMGFVIESFYCRKCDMSYTDRETVEEAIEQMKSGKKMWIVSQLKFRGAAS